MTIAIAIEFDFETRKERTIGAAEAPESCELGRQCWIDIDLADRPAAEDLMRRLGLTQMIINEVIDSRAGGRHDFYEGCVHTAVNSPHLVDGRLEFTNVDIILGDRYIMTIHEGPVPFLDLTRKSYQPFFSRFALSLGFLLFEFWDHLIESYRKCLHQMEDDVEKIQVEIFTDIDDEIFLHVSKVMQNLIELRKSLQADREVLQQLAVRRNEYVPETTQPFLLNMVGTMDRLSGDVTVEREALAETLTLYLGIVSHRTNRVITRLTVLSAIFLPLSFMAGVYGMNFVNLPELKWPYGYAFFWCLVATIVCTSLWFCHRRRWL